MKSYSKLADGQKLIDQHRVSLPNGKTLVSEVIQTGPDSFIAGSVMLDGETVIKGTWCGTCSGQSVGCVDCRNNDPVLDCINMRIYCAS